MRLIALVAPAILGSAAFAQSFNIDVTDASGLVSTPLPSTAFGAAAGQPGVWNAVDCGLVPLPNGLIEVTGSLTPVTMTRTGGGGIPGPGGSPAMAGDDIALMGDTEISDQPRTWRIDGLAAGSYVVHTYAAWDPDGRTGVSINGGPVTSVGGVWNGTYVLGVTHAVDTVNVVSGGSISIQITYLSGVFPFGIFNGLQLTRHQSISSFCDGSTVGTTCLACGNNGTADNGCANSSFSSGGHLVSSGVAGASSGTDTLLLTATNITGPTLFLQASGLSGTPITFGDGELCATMALVRMGVVFPVAGSASYPGGSTPLPIHIMGATTPGDVRHYQCWYRDAFTFCTAATFNMTQGLTITWE